MEQENSWVLFIGSPWLLCVQEIQFSISPLPSLSQSSQVVTSFCQQCQCWRLQSGWEILADNTGAKRKQRKLLTKIKLQLCSCRVGACSALSLCRDVTSLERDKENNSDSFLGNTGYGNHFLFMQMEIFNWHWNVSPALGMYELAQAGGDVLSCLIWVFKILIWKVWMAAVGRVVTGPWRWGMIPRLRFHLVYNSWHNVHRFPEFIFRPSVPDPVSSWSSKSCLKPRQSAHHSEEDNKIKIKYILPASNFNLHMHGGDDSNPWRCCGRCCCPGLIAWPLILAWQPLWAVSASLKLFSKLLYWCEEEEQSQVQTLNDRVALFGHIATLLLWTVVLMLKIKS